MFIICRKAHLGMFWNGEKRIFIEDESCIIPSRKDCLAYLSEEIGREWAIQAITSMQKNPQVWYSF